MLNARQLDLAVLFDTDAARRWSVTPLLEEKLYLIRSAPAGGLPAKAGGGFDGCNWPMCR
jgi:LysR family tcuABC transcriptional regulator